MLRRNGMLVHKFDSSGDLSWSYPLVGLGAAIRPPEVSPMSGDVVLLTRTHLLSLSPDGRVGLGDRTQGASPMSWGVRCLPRRNHRPTHDSSPIAC